MKFLLRISIIFLLFIVPSISTAQTVSGLQIDYEKRFVSEPETAKKWLANIPNDIQQYVLSMEVFVAPPKGIIEMKLLKFRYIPQLNASIDGAAKESAHSVSILDGIKNFKQKVIQTKISGHDARLVSIQADRWGGKIGVESLIIYNQRNNTMWQLQLLFGKKKGINPFKSLNIETEQNYSKILLKSVKVLN